MKCPFCGEQIQADAVKCRYCREWLTARPSDGSEGPAVPALAETTSTLRPTDIEIEDRPAVRSQDSRWEGVFGDGGSYERHRTEAERRREAIHGPRPTRSATTGSSGSPGSGSAVTSLILGIVGVFIPVILSILAIIFGGVGINNANSRGASGKGMAIAGLVLGILGTLGWIGYLGTRGT